MYRQTVSRLTLIAFAALIAQIAAVSFAAAQVLPGELITAQDARKIEQLVSPGVYLRVTRGMSMQIVPSERIEWPPPYREATEKYAAQVSLSRDHRSLNGYVAGLPFPFIDANDPDAGTKIIWNNTFRPTSTDDYDARDFSCISESEGLNRKYAPIDYYEMGHLASYNLVGRTEVEPLPIDPDFRTSGRLLLMAFYPMLAPQTERGRGFIRYRYADPATGDDTWSWIPGNRRIRRFSEATLGTSAGPITWSLDNFQGLLPRMKTTTGASWAKKPCSLRLPPVTCPRSPARPTAARVPVPSAGNCAARTSSKVWLVATEFPKNCSDATSCTSTLKRNASCTRTSTIAAASSGRTT